MGNITHQVNTSNVVVAEYNFDACSVKLGFCECSETKTVVELIPMSEADREGRRRSADDWSYTLDANDLALFADRGFTGHEYLPWFNLYNMNGRMYDPLVGRFLSADPFIQDPSNTQNLNRYSYCLNNPLKYNDPSGEFWNLLFVWFGNYAAGWLDNTINKGMSPKQAFSQTPIMLGGNYSPSANQFSNYQVNAQKIVKNDTAAKNAVGSLEGVRGQYGNEWHGVDAFSGAATSACPDCINSTTIGRNIPLLGGRSTYAGGDNPLTYSGDETYSYAPTKLTDYPAIGHDRRYDNIGTRGLKGLFTDTRAIGADWKFVSEEFGLAFNPYFDPATRINAGLLGIGLGLFATPKTIFQLSNPYGYYEIMFWYGISNVGVTNAPSIHKH